MMHLLTVVTIVAMIAGAAVGGLPGAAAAWVGCNIGFAVYLYLWLED